MSWRTRSSRRRVGLFAAVILAATQVPLWSALADDPPEPSDPPGISGTVTSEAGGPIPHASVTVWAWSDDWFGWHLHSGTHTDANGEYGTEPLDPGIYTLQFFDGHNGGTHLTQWWDGKSDRWLADEIHHVGEPLTDFDAVLKVGGAIEGRVTDGANGLAGITVTAWSVATFDSEQVQTDGGGYFRIPKLAGEYVVQVHDDTGTYAGAWYANADRREDADVVTAVPPDTTSLSDIVLDMAGGIAGTVTAPSGDPIEGVFIWVTDSSFTNHGEATTDSDGYYEVRGLRTGNDYRLQFATADPAYLDGWYGGTDNASATSVTVTQPLLTDIDFVMPIAAVISGTVEGPDGPLQSIEVSVRHAADDMWAGGAFTQEDGAFVVGRLSPGTYLVEFIDWTGTHARQWFDGARSIDDATVITLTEGEHRAGVDALLGLASSIEGTVFGAVEDGDPVPLGGIVVIAYDLDENLVTGWYSEDGSYRLSPLTGGSYKIYYWAEPTGTHASQWWGGGTSFADAAEVTIGEAEHITGVDWTLPLALADTTPPTIAPMPDITVQTTDPGGTAVTYSDPVANDDVGVTVPPSCDPPSGSTFTVGETVVTCEGAEDAAGNTSDPISFVVTVSLVDHDDVLVAVSSPNPGEVTITTVEDPGPDPDGYTLVGVQIEISAPPATQENPLVFVFSIDGAAAPPDTGAADIVVLRDGVLVDDCDPASPLFQEGGADPDPCVAARDDTGYRFEITVRTSSASLWSFALENDEGGLLFDFAGFYPPVGDVDGWIAATAGSAIPVKFSLGADHGPAVLAHGQPSLTEVVCDTGAPVGSPGQASSPVGLNYDSSLNLYTFVWKTARTMASKCFRFDVGLTDGQVHSFFVHFRR